jgi:ABC-type phosphate transport system substrate-binding protein
MVINLTDPHSADVIIRLGAPDDLTTPAFQISTEDILVITHPQAGIASLNMEQVRSIFLGQTLNWKEVGGNDLAVQVWSFSPNEDAQEIFNKVVMHGEPVTSTARLAVSSKNMAEVVKTNPGSIGVLPRRYLTDGEQNVFNSANVPVLAITQVVPIGIVNGLINCLQRGSH